jgi:hypothetical protein
MGDRRAAKRRILPRVALVVVAFLGTSGIVAVGLATGDPGHPPATKPRPTPSATPVRKVNLSKLPIARGPFCSLLPHSAAEQALGGPVTRTEQYGNGDNATLAPGTSDVSHEFSCAFDAADGSQARAWVFAPPVQTSEAATLAAQARKERGCSPAKAPRFGTPTVATLCHESSPKRNVVTLRGLFGSAWLSCQLTSADPASQVEQRATQWCVTVATTLGARP